MSEGPVTPLLEAMAEVYAQVEADGWEAVLQRFGFDLNDVGAAVASAQGRDPGTMLCVGAVLGSLYQQGIAAAVERAVEQHEAGGRDDSAA